MTQRAAGAAHAIAVGLVVGGLFLSFAAHQIAVVHGGNASGPVRISHRYFDRDPAVNERDELRDSLRFAEGDGYDGQFFYLMAFDPFLTMLREHPRGYTTFFDAPPYRYGRIGFSLLTKAFSLDRPARYPITMVGLVVGALALCGALLGLIARRHGLSPWYGALIAFIPGFWQSVDVSLPEPVAVAFFLGAYLCLIHKRWWACGALLGLSMLVRETGGALVLAVAASLVVTGRRREGLIVGLLAFLPVVLWRGFVGWVFWPINGLGGVFPHPDDAGLPFAGVWHMWTLIAHGDHAGGAWNAALGAVTYSLLTTAGAALAAIAVWKRPGPIAVAALVYAGLTVMLNYEAVWVYLGNAHRLTVDLFVALALVFVQPPADRRPLRWAFALFWCASAGYVLCAAFELDVARRSLIGWFTAS